MKKNLLYLMLFSIPLVTACSKATVPPTHPLTGVFTGQFMLLQRHTDKVPFDTTKATITLTLQPSYTYTLTGDTSTVHAGSFGSFETTGGYIIFQDKTYPKTGIPTKTHLNGEYLYYYDGTNFQMLAYSSDTLSLEYNLTKSQ